MRRWVHHRVGVNVRAEEIKVHFCHFPVKMVLLSVLTKPAACLCPGSMLHGVASCSVGGAGSVSHPSWPGLAEGLLSPRLCRLLARAVGPPWSRPAMTSCNATSINQPFFRKPNTSAATQRTLSLSLCLDLRNLPLN